MMTLLYILLGLAAVAALLLCALVVINEHAREAVQQRLDELPISDEHKAAAWACFERAETLAPFWRSIFNHLAAPVILLAPLMLLPWSADALPAWLAYWANNAGINGDGLAVLRNGVWIYLGDIGWTPAPGERVYAYDEPDYTGDAYYALGWHPRSWFARWVWLAFRNVASLRDVLGGADVAQRPTLLASESDTAGGDWSLMWDGGALYQFTLDAPLIWGIRWRANVGYKLGIVANRTDPLTPSDGGQIGSARASVICMWVALRK